MKYIFKIALIAAMFALFTQFAAATAILSISNGNKTIWTADDGVLDAWSDPGVITLLSSFTNWKVNVTTGSTKPISGSATEPFMDLNTFDISSTANGKLTIMFSDADFFMSGNWNFKSEVGGTTAGTVSVKTYYDVKNKAHKIGDTLGVLATDQSFTSTAFSGTEVFTGLPTAPSTPYSLTQVIEINHRYAGTTSLDAQLTSAPEPSALLLLGSGLSMLGLFRFRKKE